MKNNLSVLLLFLCFFSSQIYGNSIVRKINDYSLSNIQSDDLRLVDSYCEVGKTYIAILIDGDDNKFILKQKMNSLFAVVFEKLVTDIAYEVDIPANLVRIISYNFPFIGKENKHIPATLHTFAPGIAAKDLPEHLSKYSVSLRQLLKGGSAKVAGFRRMLVYRMSLHEDFPKIIALDTFIANHDRHAGNFFYDEETDHFFAIDFEAAFRKNLAENVYKCFVSMAKDKKLLLSPEEVKSLVVYRDMLKKLVDTYNPEILYSRMDELMDKARSDAIRKEINWDKKEWYKEMMLANYNSCNKVIDILETLIEKCRG